MGHPVVMWQWRRQWRAGYEQLERAVLVQRLQPSYLPTETSRLIYFHLWSWPTQHIC